MLAKLGIDREGWTSGFGPSWRSLFWWAVSRSSSGASPMCLLSQCFWICSIWSVMLTSSSSSSDIRSWKHNSSSSLCSESERADFLCELEVGVGESNCRFGDDVDIWIESLTISFSFSSDITLSISILSSSSFLCSMKKG